MASPSSIKQVNMKSHELYKRASQDREAFFASEAECLHWFSPWKKVLDWQPPYAKWFIGGELNACYNCLDRHMETDVRYKTALIWEGENGDERRITYEELYREVNQFSKVLRELGVKKGDKIAIYLPMVVEAVVAMLSAARIGAVHTVIFGGFSSDALKDRIIDANAKVLITADGGYRKGKIIPLKKMADQALSHTPSIEKVIAVKRTGHDIEMQFGRDFWYHDLMIGDFVESPPEIMDAEDQLFILYTSGTTGKPKGIIHTTGGYMVGATTTTRRVFDIQPSDIYWCTADVGWITGHSYVVYGPLSNGMTEFIYEGAPDYPDKDRFWKLIEKYGVTILYTAPTAIRMFMKWGEEWPNRCNLSSLRLLGSVGEPINPEAWLWYYTHIGKSLCPVIDTWWQTETGSIMIAPIPGNTPLKPGSATHPMPGIDVEIVDGEGNSQSSGYLVITSPWPSMLRGIHNDPLRYEETYWKQGNGKYYFTGDGATRDEEGYYWLSGRVDDVINVSGHRLGTMEVESALVDHMSVAEAAVIAIPHSIKGQSVAAFITLKEKALKHQGLEEELKEHVAKKIGGFARPEKVIFIGDLPKTRSGKIMRRLLRDIAEGRIIGDQTTLSDPNVIKEIQMSYQD